MNTIEAWQPNTKVFTPDDNDLLTAYIMNTDGLTLGYWTMDERMYIAMMVADSAIAKILTR